MTGLEIFILPSSTNIKVVGWLLFQIELLFFYFNKAFLGLLSVVSTAISQHHKGFFPPLSEYLKCFGDKTACGSLAGTGALLVKQLGKA